jgi:nitrite reductase (NADH) small subunit
MTADWIAVATTKDLARRRKLRVEVNGVAIALFQADGQVHALADTCIHQDRSLFKGTLLHGRVICPGHQWAFELDDGYEESQDRYQPTYSVRVEADTIYLNPTPRVGTCAPAGKEAEG